jgi:hypothetical protein
VPFHDRSEHAARPGHCSLRGPPPHTADLSRDTDYKHQHVPVPTDGAVLGRFLDAAMLVIVAA